MHALANWIARLNCSDPLQQTVKWTFLYILVDVLVDLSLSGGPGGGGGGVLQNPEEPHLPPPPLAALMNVG